jgi:hypothetical protein
LEEAIAQATHEDAPEASSAETVAPQAPKTTSSDAPQTTTQSDIAYLITVQQYEGGPWWTRAFLAHHTLGALPQANRDQRASATQDSAAAVSTHVDAVLDKLLEKNVSPAAEAAHPERDEAIRLATDAVMASGWKAIVVE